MSSVTLWLYFLRITNTLTYLILTYEDNCNHDANSSESRLTCSSNGNVNTFAFQCKQVSQNRTVRQPLTWPLKFKSAKVRIFIYFIENYAQLIGRNNSYIEHNIDYVQRSCSSLYRLPRFINCPTYITLHYLHTVLLNIDININIAKFCKYRIDIVSKLKKWYWSITSHRFCATGSV